MLRKLVAAIIIAAASLSSAFASEGKYWNVHYPDHAKPGYGCYAYVDWPASILKAKVTNGYIGMVFTVEGYVTKGSVTISIDNVKYRMNVVDHAYREGWTDIKFGSRSTDLYWSLIKGNHLTLYTDSNMYGFRLTGSAKAIRTCLKGPEPRKTYATPHRETGSLRLVKMDYTTSTGNSIYMLTGVIDMYADKRLEHYLKAIPYGSRVFLNSRGGSIVAAGLIGRMLEDRAVETAVFNEDKCASACAIIFAYGDSRVVWKGSKIGLHRVSYDNRSGVSANDAASVVQEVTALLIGLFNRKGIDSRVLTRMLDTPASSMYWMTHNEALRLRLASAVMD